MCVLVSIKFVHLFFGLIFYHLCLVFFFGVVVSFRSFLFCFWTLRHHWREHVHAKTRRHKLILERNVHVRLRVINSNLDLSSPYFPSVLPDICRVKGKQCGASCAIVNFEKCWRFEIGSFSPYGRKLQTTIVFRTFDTLYWRYFHFHTN